MLMALNYRPLNSLTEIAILFVADTSINPIFTQFSRSHPDIQLCGGQVQMEVRPFAEHTILEDGICTGENSTYFSQHKLNLLSHIITKCDH